MSVHESKTRRKIQGQGHKEVQVLRHEQGHDSAFCQLSGISSSICF